MKMYSSVNLSCIYPIILIYLCSPRWNLALYYHNNDDNNKKCDSEFMPYYSLSLSSKPAILPAFYYYYQLQLELLVFVCFFLPRRDKLDKSFPFSSLNILSVLFPFHNLLAIYISIYLTTMLELILLLKITKMEF